ncbi:MAG: hypothetical protein H7X97_10445 [Opitutaceae bacterium]|nr:hypothetical protein [Verrucomicrobiales bacterium]
MKDPFSIIRYEFKLENGLNKEFVVKLRPPALQLVIPDRARVPVWTRLSEHQCPNCPLRPETSPHCPAALSLIEVVEQFKDSWSIENAEVTVTMSARQYRRTVPLQVGVSSLIGLYMATSGCPIMNKFRPMVHTHLPFATVEETIYRSISMYLLTQFFRNKRGHVADWELKNLVKIYDDINLVNQNFSKRLMTVKTTDASLNALSGLDCFASITALSIVEDTLDEIESLFQAHLVDQPVRS